MSGRLGFAVALIGACAGPGRPALSVAPGPVDCQPVDSVGGFWRVTVFIDGKRVGDHLRARREQLDPETFELSDAEPPALASLPPEAVDLLQFSRGEDAETTVGLCPGYVALLVTTKRPR